MGMTMNASSMAMAQEPNYGRYAAAALISAFLILLPDVLLASDPDYQISNTLCEVVRWLNGSTGRAVATIAVIVVGVMALAGRLNWSMAIIVVAGIAILFGAKSIVEALAGSDTAACDSGGLVPPPTGPGPA